jgi:hypothetical protein
LAVCSIAFTSARPGNFLCLFGLKNDRKLFKGRAGLAALKKGTDDTAKVEDKMSDDGKTAPTYDDKYLYGNDDSISQLEDLFGKIENSEWAQQEKKMRSQTSNSLIAVPKKMSSGWSDKSRSKTTNQIFDSEFIQNPRVRVLSGQSIGNISDLEMQEEKPRPIREII